MTASAPEARPDRSNRRRVALFFIALVGWSAVFLWPWTGVDQRFAMLFKAAGNAALDLISSDSGYADPGGQPVEGLFGATVAARLEVQFTEPDPFGERQRDIAMGVLNFAHAGQDGWQQIVRLSSRHLAYIPLAVWCVMALATPVPPRRRAAVFAWGLPAMLLFVGVRCGLVLADAFEGTAAHCAFVLSPPWSTLFDGTVATLAEGLTVTYLVPVGGWLVVVFARRDVDWLGLPGWPAVRPDADPPPPPRPPRAGATRRRNRGSRRKRGAV